MPPSAAIFEGFELPKYTQIPNQIIDFIMPHLTGNEFKVLLYIARRTLGFHRSTDSISIKQLVTGMKKRDDGSYLNCGTGLSEATVKRCLNSLEKKQYIVRQRNSDKKRGDLPTTYALKFRDTPVAQNEPPPRSSKRATPVAQNEPHKRNKKQKKQQQKGVVALLKDRGVSANVARFLADGYDHVYIQNKLDYLHFLQDQEPKNVKRPAAWLRRAIEEDYAAPDGYLTKSERQAKQRKQEKLIEERQLAEQEESDQVKKQFQAMIYATEAKFKTQDQDREIWQRVQSDLAKLKTQQLILPALHGLQFDTRKATASIGVSNSSMMSIVNAPKRKTQLSREIADSLNLTAIKLVFVPMWKQEP